MSLLTELSSEKHGDWKLAENCAMDIAESQHILNLKVTEVGKAASNFPIFFTQMGEKATWAISAIACLELNKSLFVKDGEWQATYLPIGLRTYPFFLMQSDSDQNKFTVGIEESNPAFSTRDGEPLFEDEGKAGERLSKATVLLQEELKNELLSYKFAKRLEELGLLTAVNLLVGYGDGTTNSLTGLFVIDEEKLKSLSTEDFNELRDKGYLVPIYAMLISTYQVNALIQRHNQAGDSKRIVQVKIEPQKEKPAAETLQ